jgi:integrase/recombinase XerD
MGRRAGAPAVYLPPGKTVYLCRFTCNGIRYRLSTGETDPRRAAEAARRLAAETELHGHRRITRRVGHAAATSLDALSGEYLASVEASGRSPLYFKAQAKHFRAHFLPRWERLPDVLTPGAIDRYKVERANEKTNRKRKVSPVTIYKELVTLSMFLRWCKRHGYIAEVPEFERVRPVSDYDAPNLSEEQIAALLAELPRRERHPKRLPAYEYHAVQWTQGMRPGEIATLQWSDVDLARRRITIRQRNDKARAAGDRVIGMSELAHAILSAEAKRATRCIGLVFGRRTFRASIKLAAKRAGLPPVTPHHLRHARLTELAGLSQDVGALQMLAGHKHLSTTDRYVRSRTERTVDLLAIADSGTPNRRGARKRPAKRGAMKR